MSLVDMAGSHPGGCRAGLLLHPTCLQWGWRTAARFQPVPPTTTTRSLQAQLRQGPPKLFLTQQIAGPAPTCLMVNQGDRNGQ